MIGPLSVHTFVLALTGAAALLAFWILARFANFGPRSVVWAFVHVVLACLVLRLLPFGLDAIGGIPVPAIAYVELFGLVLPLFVYAFLSGGWVGRAAMDLLRR